ALDAAGAGDVDSDHTAVEVDERAAAIGRLDDRVVLEDGRKVALLTQLAAHAVLVDATPAAPAAGSAAARTRVRPPAERNRLLEDGVVAMNDDLDHVARLVRLD